MKNALGSQLIYLIYFPILPKDLQPYSKISVVLRPEQAIINGKS